MMKLLSSGQWTERGKPSFDVQGREHGVELCVILEDMPAGGGPKLHKHPYGEAWVVSSGKAEFSDGTQVRHRLDRRHHFRRPGDAAQIQEHRRRAAQNRLHPRVGAVQYGVARMRSPTSSALRARNCRETD